MNLQAIQFRPDNTARMKASQAVLFSASNLKVQRLDLLNVHKFPILVASPVLIRDAFVIRATDPPTAAVQPFVVGDSLLLVDAVNRRVHHRLVQPVLVSAGVTIARTPQDQRTAGGSASITLRCHHLPDSALWELQAGAWPEALTRAGHGSGPWSFQPLRMYDMRAELTLPPGHLTAPVTAAVSADSGSVSYLVSLSETGARDWRLALQSGQTSTLVGIASVAASAFVATGDSTAVTSRPEMLEVPLATLMSSVSADNLRLVDPEASVDARILVAPYDGIESVLVEARSRRNQTVVTQRFGPEGGELTCAVTSDDLTRDAVDWKAVISFATRAWPSICLTGELSGAAGGWSTIVRPGSWTRALTVFTTLHDENGKLTAGSEGDLVVGELRHEAPFLEGGALTTSFRLTPGELTTVEFPSPPTQLAVTTRLTVQSVRNGSSQMVTRDLSERDTMIGVRVDADAKTKVTTNTSVIGEEDESGPAFDAAPAPRAPEEITRPEIIGPQQWPASSEPPAFDVFSGDLPFYMVEITADPELLHLDGATGRDSGNYWFGGTEDGAFAAGGSYLLPQQVWDDLGGAARLYYRVFASERDDGFVGWAVSTGDDELGQLPEMRIGASGPASDPAAASRDVGALCTYLAVSREQFEVYRDRYFARLSELLAFHGTISSGFTVDESSFRAAVRQFQSGVDLPVDGIPGEDTCWELNVGWAQARSLELERVPMDRWTPPGVAQHVPASHGFDDMRVRSDIADAVRALRSDLNAAGVLMTSGGAARALDAVLTPGRSATSIHYSAAAFDLATVSGMVRSAAANAENQLYVVTRAGTRWNVWARSADGAERTLRAVEWQQGVVTERQVSGQFIDVTELAARHGFRPIGPRSNFPADYLSAEWWHFQNEEVLIPWISQFGSELLSMADYDEADLRREPRIWDARKRIFQRGQNGWW